MGIRSLKLWTIQKILFIMLRQQFPTASFTQQIAMAISLPTG
jgi:hypothetical protein